MKTQSIIAVAVSMSLLVLASSCGGQKHLTDKVERTKIDLPMSGSQYKSDAEYFRATASGESDNLEMARRIANLNARTILAGFVETYVEEFVKAYTEQYEDAVDADYIGKFRTAAMTSVQQELNQAVLKGEELYQLGNGKYQYWVNLEMPRKPVNDDLKARISDDEKLGVDFQEYQMDKWIEEFKAERAAAENQQ